MKLSMKYLSGRRWRNRREEKHTDGINTGSRAGVTASWATVSGARLSRCVANTVTASAASTLEGVVKTEPVASLVGESVAQVVRGSSSSWDGGVEDDNTIVLGSSRVARWEGGIAEKASASSRDEAIDDD